MPLSKILQNRRTIRKFKQEPISCSQLERYVEIARLSPSGANLQPLKYVIVQSEEQVAAVFKETKWAGYLNGSYTPSDLEQPTAFIAVFCDSHIPDTMAEFDAGAAIMSINILAEEDGLGCCIMKSIHRENICKILNTDDNLRLMYVVALGYKGEHPECVDITDGDIKYYIENDVLKVPKRKKSEVLVKIL